MAQEGVTRLALVVVAVLVAVGVASCGGSDGAAPSGDRYLVLPEDTPGLAVGQDEQGYGSGVLRSDGTATAALVRTAVMPGSWEQITDGRATATLANGLEVFYVCGGRGAAGASQDEPTGDTVMGVYGPLMVVARVDGGYLTVEDSPTDTSSCTQPTAVEGPLVDVAASLRWVDGAEFQRMLERFPAPERTSTPTTG